MKQLLVSFFLLSGFYLESIQIEEMNLEEKVGQLLVVHFRGETANEQAKQMIQELSIGGFIYYNWSNELHSPEQVRELSRGLQGLAKETRWGIPLFIGVDQEGGLVSRLNQGFVSFPGNRALGMAKHPLWAEESAYLMGREMRSVGINMNFAPVVDINSNPFSPFSSLRAYGNTPEEVSALGALALKGFHRAGIITSLKHFPGHGDVAVDSHFNLPVVDKSLAKLEKLELVPFRQLHAQTDTIMTAHLLVPALDDQHSVTLSKKALDFLREEIGFQGVIVSDSLVMQGVLQEASTVEKAALEALKAGCDLLLLGGKVLLDSKVSTELDEQGVARVHRALVAAVRSGELSEKRVNEAVGRVLRLKSQYELDHPLAMGEKEKEEARTLSKNIAKAALSDCFCTSASFSLSHIAKQYRDLGQKNVLVLVPKELQPLVDATPLASLGKENDLLFYQGNEKPEELHRKIEQALAKRKVDLFILCSYNAWENPRQFAFLELMDQSMDQSMGQVRDQSMNHGKNQLPEARVLIVLGNPLDAVLFPSMTRILTTYSPTVPSLEAACEKLLQERL